MISVVGAVIELSLAMAERLRKDNKAAKIQLVHPQQELLPGAPQKLRQHLETTLQVTIRNVCLAIESIIVPPAPLKTKTIELPRCATDT